MDDLNFLDPYLGLQLLDLNGSFVNFSLSSLNLSVRDVINDDSMYERNLLMYYLMGICGMAVCSFGIIGNILSIIVLSRGCMKSSTYSYLTALSISDLLFLILTMFILSRDSEKPHQEITWGKPFYIKLFPYIHPAAITFQVTSIWLTCAFTLDRYVMICHPFKAERWCKISTARKTIVGVFLAGLVFNIIRFFEYETSEIVVETNSTEPRQLVIKLTDLGNSEEFREIVHSWLYLTCVAGIPFLSLLVLNVFLIHAVHESRKKGKLINAKERRRNDTTIMLIGVVVIFLICQGPALISRMIWAFDYQKAFVSAPWYTFNEVSNFLVILNSAINIVPYYFFGKRFRNQFWKIFCKCFFTKEEMTRLSRKLSATMHERQHSLVNQHEINEENQLHVFMNSKAFKKFSQKYRSVPRDDEPYDTQDNLAGQETKNKCEQNGHPVLRVNFEPNGNCKAQVETCDTCQSNAL
ncbi:FMRFamide receptor-like [Saccostrea cucullata]|uniref:FMRFamide receptor-like n=1 Tax=Saccostrea cuccullata TaxID=36930 RepID=UPI002ED0DB8B